MVASRSRLWRIQVQSGTSQGGFVKMSGRHSDSFRVYTFIFLLVTAGSGGAFSPERVPGGGNLVDVAFLGGGGDGSVVGKLCKKGIEILEDGGPQKNLFFAKRKRVPLRLG